MIGRDPIMHTTVRKAIKQKIRFSKKDTVSKEGVNHVAGFLVKARGEYVGNTLLVKHI